MIRDHWGKNKYQKAACVTNRLFSLVLTVVRIEDRCAALPQS